MSELITADQLRSTFLEFFERRGHHRVRSCSLIPTHPAAPIFTNAGMIQFLPYFFGEEPPPYRRATSSQKCVRVKGKHDDIAAIGRTTRHLTFFEMLGSFSFGDYFKKGAIDLAWEFLTEVLGLEAARLWVTVHTSDDEAAELWVKKIGMLPARVQRLEEDNFWEMGDTGPCGPSSEIFYDKGPEHGKDGGPQFGGEERFVEIWNLVFMQMNRLEDGSLEPLPRRHIDTGAGLERVLPILQNTNSVFETDVLLRLIHAGAELTGCTYGRDVEDDVSLRILADHARAITFLLGDGVVPSNEGRGYVLRRIIRRAVRHARRVGASKGVLPRMAQSVSELMYAGYPELSGCIDSVSATLEREEHRFLQTLSVGLGMLDDILASGSTVVDGELAFKLHDTYGFPIDLTEDVARDHGATVDRVGFDTAMERQRERARASAGEPTLDEREIARYRALLNEHGPTKFVGYDQLVAEGQILAIHATEKADEAAVFVDKTPFYAEGGGQIGDVGLLVTETGRGRVLGTTEPIPGLYRHQVKGDAGADLRPGQSVLLTVDEASRAAIRRNHTATHLLQWALREVLGTQVHQQGSQVTPHYLRFDFNYYSALKEDQLREVEDLVNSEILSNRPVDTRTMSMAEAIEAGALAFFGERYGERVRVVRAGTHSIELCGGTHVERLGEIGSFLIKSESSIGSNLRRIEAITGTSVYLEARRRGAALHQAASTLRTTPDGLGPAIDKLLHAQAESGKEVERLKAILDEQFADKLVAQARRGVLVARVDGRAQPAMKSLVDVLRQRGGVRGVGLVGTPDGSSVCIAVAVSEGMESAIEIARHAATIVGGGGGGRNPLLAFAGGRDVTQIDRAVEVLSARLTGSAGPEES